MTNQMQLAKFIELYFLDAEQSKDLLRLRAKNIFHLINESKTLAIEYSQGFPTHFHKRTTAAD